MDREVKIRLSEGAIRPRYATAGSAGADVHALLECIVSLEPGQRTLIPTGLYFEIPEGYELQVRPRSGLALRQGITVLNTPGTIDSDYRGELQIVLINHGEKSVEVRPGDRIAQIVLAPVLRMRFREVESLSVSERGEQGFGHTGL